MVIRTANPPLNGRQTIVWTPNLLGMVHATVRLAGLLADHHTGYQGLWDIGVRIEGLGGSVPVEAMRDPDLFTYDRYDPDVYERITTATTGDLVDQAPAVIERLLAMLLRDLRIDTNYLPYSAEVLQSMLR